MTDVDVLAEFTGPYMSIQTALRPCSRTVPRPGSPSSTTQATGLPSSLTDTALGIRPGDTPAAACPREDP